MEIVLGEVAYVRGENRGSLTETSLAAHTPDGYDFVLEHVTRSRLRLHLGLSDDAGIVCTGMPILGAVQVVLSNAEERVGAESLGEALLGMRVDIAEERLRRCKL